MLAVECVQCHKEFGAQRKTAQYCSSKCRVAATRSRQRTGVVPGPAVMRPLLPERREGGAVVALPPTSDGEHSLAALTIEDLEAANRLRTPAGLLSVKLAQILDSGVQDSGSSIAALGRQYLATMATAMAGVKVSETPLEALRRSRQVA